MKKHYLLTPGPAQMPEDILESMGRPIIHHRTQQYRDIVKSANENLKKVFKTTRNVLTFTSSGTGAMEASVVNTLSKGDTAIVVRGGKFGERFDEICRAYGVEVVVADVTWGERPEARTIDVLLQKHPDTKAVFMQLCETSTATVYDVEAIGKVVSKTPAILVVDAISGLGSDEFKMDEWNVDVAIGGSQKGFMLPPGLSFCAVSEKAWNLVKKSTLPKYYYDFLFYEKLMGKSDSPFTPAITLVIGLEKAMSAIVAEGVDAFIRRHREDARYVRETIKEMGLTLFSRFPSDAVTAANIPGPVDGAKLLSSLKSKGVTLAGGQAELKGKIFRIAQMGGITRKDLEFALGILKDTLKEIWIHR
ncbi:MAG: alanine--glyoxylate aminotransferase family protein [Candidatus Omnitrophota bacterium]